MSVETSRVKLSLIEAGGGEECILFIHGNLMCKEFWDDVVAELAGEYRCIAVDLRGFGDSEAKPVDATQGVRDYSMDLLELSDLLKLSRVHLVAHSMGAAVALQYLLDSPQRVASVTLAAPVSPYGFGGTRDINGTPCYPDYAGSGGGLIAKYNPRFLELLSLKYTGADEAVAPRLVLRGMFKQGYTPPVELEERLLKGMLKAKLGEEYYPGDYVESPNWPHVAPGSKGVLNSISPRYLNLHPAVDLEQKPPVLWLRGAYDLVVSDRSLYDPAVLGQLEIIPGYPGEDEYPPQPMESQMRALLEEYAEKGGYYREVQLDTGHMIPLEARREFVSELRRHIS
ncbi:MAG: alpha/beta hydrolase [Thermoproteota archaeon]|nr:MAG: alpha/beta hydrolase [Candidatus Korarchaeota archaeon]RLG53549.1 MAG: alpha/beta hydrolase [Candidatus Korarchaeota archaeon]